MRNRAIFLSICLMLAVQARAQESPGVNNEPLLLGLASAVHVVPDLEAAADWYEQALGLTPYFEETYYVGFRIGGQELGLVPHEEGMDTGAGGAVPYWIVADVEQAVDQLVQAGATSIMPVMDVGGGTFVATVADPYGNSIGLIEIAGGGD